VAGAGQRQFGLGDVEGIGGAAFDQGNGLQRLDGGAGVDRALVVAGGQHHLALGIDHGQGGAVAAFHLRAAGHFDKQRIDGVSVGRSRI
jgi:hypothetical protein